MEALALRGLVTVDRRDAHDEAELLKNEIGQVGAQAADREKAAGKAGHRARSGTSKGRAAHQHRGVIRRLKAGRARFQRRDVAADLLRIDLFEERPKDFLEKRVSPLFQLTN